MNKLRKPEIKICALCAFGCIAVLALAVFAFLAAAGKLIGSALCIGVILCGAIALCLFAGLAFSIVRRVLHPLGNMEKSLQQLTTGQVNNINADFGFTSFAAKQVEDSFAQMIAYLERVIGDMQSTMYEIAHNGDFTTATHAEYRGDFLPIKASIDELLESLLDVFTKLAAVSGTVLTGAEQLAEGNTELANGATQQAGDAQELFMLITGLAEGFGSSARHAEEANTCTELVDRSVGVCKGQMDEVSEAMNRISESSAKIDKIIKTIDQIAFQTNILALNAAVEAARAGEAGKGFAVVADEVRMLANSTAEAAQETTQLIQESLTAIENGIRSVAQMETTFSAVTEGAAKSTHSVTEIAGEIRGYAHEIETMKEHMSSVVSICERNAGIAENSQASCEELYAQVGELDALVRRVKIG